jgi:phage shock protein A
MPRMKIVSCPLCKGKLEIDLNTGLVYRHFEKIKGKEAEEKFDRFVDKVAERENAASDVFNKATERAKGRDLDDLFQKATEKTREEIEEEKEGEGGEGGEGGE